MSSVILNKSIPNGKNNSPQKDKSSSQKGPAPGIDESSSALLPE